MDTTLQSALHTFFDVPEEDLQAIAAHFQPVTIRKGDFLLRKGRICDRLCFISSGLIRIYTEVNDKEVTQWISTGGYFVTELASFVFDRPARWDIQALTDCELYVIEKQAYDQLGKAVPGWHLLEKLFIAKCFVIIEERVLSLLSLTAEERYLKMMELQPSLFNEVPLQYLASMLGMTPETLSRLRRKMLQ